MEYVDGYRWRNTAVRTYSGDLVPFDQKRLVNDVTNAILGRMTTKDVRPHIDTYLANTEGQLWAIGTPLSAADKEAAPWAQISITDQQIGQGMAQQLRLLKDRLAHVLYGMSVLGRDNRTKPKRTPHPVNAFRSAADVLAWLFSDENYPDLRVPLRSTSIVLPKEKLTLPTTQIREPSRVAKRDRSESQAFDHLKFTRSIERGLMGRTDRTRKSALVAATVLTDLAGQETVSSQQLAVGVLNIFRRLDEVAYLRWATIHKGITSTTDFRDEALNLVNHPVSGLEIIGQVRRTRSTPRVPVDPKH